MSLSTHLIAIGVCLVAAYWISRHSPQPLFIKVIWLALAVSEICNMLGWTLLDKLLTFGVAPGLYIAKELIYLDYQQKQRHK